MLVVHKPTALVNEAAGKKILVLLREFVDCRGVEMNPNEPLIRRRKRTVVYSARSIQAAAAANYIFEMQDNGKFVPVEHEKSQELAAPPNATTDATESLRRELDEKDTQIMLLQKQLSALGTAT